MNALAATLTARLVGLLPPERRPAPGGTAAELVGMLGQIEADTAHDAFRMIYLWLASTTDEAGLNLLGHARYLRRFPGEPTEVFRQRVMGAFGFWEQAGTVPGMRLALLQAGYQAVIIEHRDMPDELRWAEFSVKVSPAQRLTADATWDSDALWNGTRSWDFRLPAVPVNFLPELIHEVKPAHARLRRLTFSPRNRFWDGGAIWDEGRDTEAAPYLGYGVYTGLAEAVLTTEQTDSGLQWDAAEDTVVYDSEDSDA